MNVGDFIRFNYRELVSPNRGETAKVTINEYSGYVSRIYKNGQFILVGTNDSTPTRFEKIGIVE